MDQNKKDQENSQLTEQEAPLKNTDHAFVQVNKDGSPHVPETREEKTEEENKKTTGLEHR